MNQDIELLKGKTLIDIQVKEKEVLFVCKNGQVLKMSHSQDCCEDVYLDDITGDIRDLVGSPLLVAEESSNKNEGENPGGDNSWTWTFYRFATRKGWAVFRWYGSSNGYYSEEVSIDAV